MTAAYETRVVPEEPTGDMAVAGAHVHDQRPSEAAAVYRAMLAAAPSTPSGWQPIETAPKDSGAIFVWADGAEYPETVRWLPYSPDVAEELRQEGYWTYADDLLADVTGVCDSSQWTHWLPLPPPPSEAGTERAGITSLRNRSEAG